MLGENMYCFVQENHDGSLLVSQAKPVMMGLLF